MSVASKVVEVMKRMGAIPSDAKNDYQRFSYVSAEAILTHARKHMSEVGLICLPAMTNITVADGVYLIQYQFTLMDSDDPDNFIVQEWAQSVPVMQPSNKGDYLDDKAIGKATTYAHKYFLKKLFMVSERDEDDIDKTNSTSNADPKTILWQQIKGDSDIRKRYAPEKYLVNTMKLYEGDAVNDGFMTVKQWLLNRDSSSDNKAS